ncbi:LysM peptidoglycan-binding domain-containing protein, partial [Microgenomates group bacterium]|nr:LysM peptidoglycan-binding domain-containing protein [Microgenomates group bacterium]
NLVNPDLIEVGQELTVPELEETPMTISTSEYLVVKGDSLWKIAVRAYADGYQWVKIWEANKANIPNPDLIEVGTKLVLPR